MSWLFWLLVTLAIITLIGHGLWVMTRALVHSIRRALGTESPQGIEARMCPECGEAWEIRSGVRRCPACNWPGPLATDDEARLRAAVGLLLQRLKRYRDVGLLSDQEAGHLASAIRSRRVQPPPAAVSPGNEPTPPEPRPAPGARPLQPEPAPEHARAPRLDVAARVRAYAEAREEDRSAPADPEPAAPGPRASLGGLLAAFMEERNIRWGELVGGLLIVGGSLALVLGYWDRIAERPILRFGLANGAVAAFFAVGLHADRRWRLPTTAHGLLLIASLLVPLSVLAIVSAGGEAAVSPRLMIGESIALTLFFALIGRSGRSMRSATPWAGASGVVLPSAAILAAGRWASPGTGGVTLIALAGVPLLAHAASTLRGVLAHHRREELGEPEGDDLLRTLGMTAFASAIALGALLDRVGGLAESLRHLAPLAPLAGAPALVAGLTAWRKAGPTLVAHRVSGAAIAAAGTMVMLAGVAIAWPEPARIVAVAAFDGLALIAVALAFELPAAIALAGGCLTVAVLVASLAVTGVVPWGGAGSAELTGAMTSARGGSGLVFIALLFEAAMLGLLRVGRRPEARALALISALAGVASLGLVAWHGFARPGDPTGATWAFAVLSAAALAGSAALARAPLFDADGPPPEALGLAWAGSGLMLAALVQGFAYRHAEAWDLALPWSSALIGHATIASAMSMLLIMRRSDRATADGAIRPILVSSALLTSTIAAARLAWLMPVADPSDLAVQLLWLSVVWLALAGLTASHRLFWGFQGVLAGSVGFAVASWITGQPWFGPGPTRWLDPRALQAEAIALALLGLAWIGFRLGADALQRSRPKDDRINAFRDLMNPPWPTFDRIQAWAAVLVLVLLAAYGAMPGVAQELAPRSFAARFSAAAGAAPLDRLVPPASAFELSGIPHGPALGVGSWALLAVALLTLLAGQRERFRRLDLLGAMLALGAAVPLLAGRWESEVAVASAMRWGGAIGLLGLSAPIWARDRLSTIAGRIGWQITPERAQGLRPMATGLAVAIAALPMLSMVVYLALASLHVHQLGSDLQEAWRWSGVAFVMLGTAGGIALAGSGWMADSPNRSGFARVSGGLMIALGALVIVAVSAMVVGSTLAGDPIVGPEPGSLFDRIGLAGSYAPPIVLAALTLVGYAIRERSSGFALSGGLLLGFGATVGWLLSGTVAVGPGDPMLWVRLAQVNAIVGSAYALGWMWGVDAWRRNRGVEEAVSGDPALTVQVALPVAMLGMVLLLGLIGLFADASPSASRSAIADPIGWIALVPTGAAIAVFARRSGRPGPFRQSAPATVVIAAMLAFGLDSGDPGEWRSYHAMMISLSLAAGGLLLLGWSRRGLRPENRSLPEAHITFWASLATIIVSLFAIKAHGFDPTQPSVWGAGGLVIAALLWAALAGWSAGRGSLYLAGGLLNLAASFWWSDTPGRWLRDGALNVVTLNLIVLAIPTPAWLWIELKAIRPVEGLRRGMVPFHRVTAWVSTISLMTMVSAWLLGDAAGGWAGPATGWGAAATIASVAVALASGFWDDRSRSEVAGLYLLGLCSGGWLVAGFDLSPAMLAWVGAVVLACYAVMAGSLWGARDGLRRIGDRLGVPRSPMADEPEAGLGWLVPANVLLSAGVILLAFVVVSSNEETLPRFSAAKAGLATALAIGLLARGERRSLLRATALGFGAAGAVAWGGAWIAPGSPTVALDRVAAATIALTGTAAGYGLGLTTLAPRATRWARAARRLVPSLLVLAGIALVVVIGAELAEAATDGTVGMSGPALVALAATMLGAAAASLVAAVVPGRDPLALPERRRTAYVYGAEAMLALLALHLGLTMPWLFSGIFARYWPVIILGLAFTGVGLGELFRRQGRLVLADPLERTGAVLPMLPLLGAFWLEPRPGEDTLFLVLAGGLYAALALLRSSAGFGAIAALAFNAGLWTVLGRRDGFGLMEHPQFWVVPPALCVLAGAYLNRDRLTQGQSSTLRHVAAGAVYLSSTTDLVLNGVAEDPWLPLVLGGLSLLGIFAGIALRVRGFLLLGMAFLGLSVFAMIWYAAVDLRQTWLWAASGIVAGVLILAAFALFEKRRREVMEVVERIRHWQA